MENTMEAIMEKKDKNNGMLVWYEITVDVIPDDGTNKFYVEVNEWSQYEEFGNLRLGINPKIGNYDNGKEYKEIALKTNDIMHIVVADTIMNKEEALRLEENLVQGFRSYCKEHGWNKRKV